MPDPNFRIFTGITPDKFDALQKEAAQNGLVIAGPIGHAELHGVGIVWSMDGTNLTVRGTHKPWIISWAHVFDILAGYIPA